MRRIALVFVVLLAPAVLAVDVVEYAAMRAARPDGRSVAVKDLTIVRDAYRLQFRSGTFHFLTPIDGRTWGAVFIGEGMWELQPSVEYERRQLRLVTGRANLETLSDSFESMVLLFSDATADEIAQGSSTVTGKPDARAVQLYEQYLNDQKRKLQTNLHLRVLQELLNTPVARGDVFLAVVDGKELAPAILVFDRHGISSLAARFADLSGEETALLSFDEANGGFWYLAPAVGKKPASRASPPRRAVDALHYAIDTTIEGQELKGTTTIEMQAILPGVRVVPIHVLPKLRIRSATISTAGDTPVHLGFVQEEVQLGRMARLFREEVADADAAVVLSAPLVPRQPVKLTIEYEGREVLQAWGTESFSVRARESWYPNLGTFVDTATYDLTYRFPKRNNLISTGKLIRETEQGDKRVAVWKSEIPMRIAGFNYGRFEKVTRTDDQSAVQVDVYTGRDRAKFAGDAMADALNAARVARLFFGNPPYSPLSVTQQVEWSFGQSWPSLVYLPTLALTSSTERAFGLENADPQQRFEINEFAKMVGWHEVAHQWWGHAVGWQSYRDAWLSEGLAEFTSAVVLNLVDSGKKYDDYWERRRRQILNKPRVGSVVHNDAGAISQSFRLETRYSPGASQTIVYSKGAYVVHMLRALLRDPRSKMPDERFITMMKDFAATYAWQSPSTDDFRRVVEKHMSPQMNAARDGTMNWFFDQWVHGTEVPKFNSTLTFAPAADGKFKISGAVWQESVSETFLSVVPLYVDFGKNVVVPIGAVRLAGSAKQEIDVELPMPQAPRRILLNAFHDVLVRD